MCYTEIVAGDAGFSTLLPRRRAKLLVAEVCEADCDVPGVRARAGNTAQVSKLGAAAKRCDAEDV